MQKLIPLQLMIFLIQIICLLGLARLFGEVVKKFGMPIVLGELLAGVILGPTVFGTLAPDIFTSLFHLPIDAGLALDGLMSLSVIFLLLAAWRLRGFSFLVPFMDTGSQHFRWLHDRTRVYGERGPQ